MVGIRVYPLKLGDLIVKYTITNNALSKSSLPGLRYALNPYIGCSHGCIYCYAKQYCKSRDVFENWGRVIYVKINLLNKLSREAKDLREGSVGVGTITDAYQPIEAIFRSTRRAIQLLLKSGVEISIQTKNPLVLRDTDILLQHRDKVNIGLTITTLSNDRSLIIEPRAPLPKSRINTLIKLSSMGLKTWVFYGPVIPKFNDDDKTVDEILKICLETNSTLYVDPLRVKPFLLDRENPLYVFVKDHYTNAWKRDFTLSVMKKCLASGLDCRRGFEETPLDTSSFP